MGHNKLVLALAKLGSLALAVQNVCNALLNAKLVQPMQITAHLATLLNISVAIPVWPHVQGMKFKEAIKHAPLALVLARLAQVQQAHVHLARLTTSYKELVVNLAATQDISPIKQTPDAVNAMLIATIAWEHQPFV